MTTNKTSRAIAVSVAVFAAMAIGSTATHAAKPPPQSPDGLELVESKSVAIVYVRPDATLDSYDKVMLDPVEVAFDKSWTSDNRQVSANDRERIRRDLAEEFRLVFTEELEEKGGYEIVQAPGPDVLRVSAALIDLYINAPDTMQAGRSRSYAMSAGRMTLIAELRDSESGAILARVADRKAAPDSGRLQWTTRSTNRADAQRILRKWADALRAALDAARTAGA